jgi:hypothetical protein
VRIGDRIDARQAPPGPSLRPQLFRPYVNTLAALFATTAREGVKLSELELNAALDGQPARELRTVYAADSLRNTGTYFTGSKLAHQLIKPFKKSLQDFSCIVDPACGAGDLLVACARYLPVQRDLAGTITAWGKQLVGFDINSAFVDATRYRLALLALARNGVVDRTASALALSKRFPFIRTRSGLQDWELSTGPALILVNPPFSYGKADPQCDWASGRVSLAASFMDKCLENAPKGSRILAILPDVLRTGTNYERWRTMISKEVRICSITAGRKFDALTQVHVFLLELEVGGRCRRRTFGWARPVPKNRRTVKDLFHIGVGAVVPFRLDGTGPWLRYANLEALAAWNTVRRLTRHIRFKGATHRTPFVTIRRTSKSDSQHRCVGTLVTGKGRVAVENHLLVAVPRDGTVKTCKKLLRLLRADSTTEWMDRRICCRHLTVSSVGDVPWFKGA